MKGEEGSIFSRCIKTVKDTLFPVFCFGCGGEGTVLCDKCLSFISTAGQWFCPTCHVTRMRGAICERCKDVSFLDAHAAALEYREGALFGALIHAWKYEYVEDVAHPLQKIVRQFVNEHRDYFACIDVVVPVPLHRRRHAERGFNQATLLARWISEEIERPYVEDVLLRLRYTPHQAKKTRDERLINVVDAFWCERSLEGKSVLLVDDVFTTGTTMQECAKALRNAGVYSVRGMSIARG